ncbi:MAG: hypothetical protein LUD68_03620 [Rikenellaceae bacterium]|nr:hypothetical protein [Rikenellaceae bacterium]
MVNFTGRVAFTDMVTFQLLGVDKVIDGRYEWGFCWFTVPSVESFRRNYRKMFKQIEIYLWPRTRNYDIDGGDIEEVEVTAPGGGGGGGPILIGGRGGGSIDGGIGTGGGDATSSQAEKVLNNKNLTENQWKQLLAWIKDMMADCMASQLLKAMENKGVSIEYDVSIPYSGQYDPQTNTIPMRDFSDNGTTLVHELFHAYQQANGGINMSLNGANLEAEAKLAGYSYDVRKNPSARDYYRNDEAGNCLFYMERNLNQDYTIRKNGFYADFQEYAKLINQTSSKYGYNSGDQNYIDNLTKLSSGC